MQAEDNLLIARSIAGRLYGTGAVVEAVGGPSDSVFRLRMPDATRILKMARDTDGGAVRKEKRLIERLAHHGIPVAHVEYAELEAARPFIIMLSAGERRAADYVNAPAALAQSVFQQMGELLARIHVVDLAAGPDQLGELIAPRDPHATLQRVQRLAQEAAREGWLDAREAHWFASLPMPPLEGRALCHGDFHAVQCIVRDGQISAVLDWESAWTGNGAIDLAVTQVYLECYCTADLLAAFFAGYLAQRQPPPGYERDYLPVRMAQALALVRVWKAQNAHAYAARALELFRAYAAKWRELI
jgi:aminoglycoside phosphotransferase (APT) family kinase protein